MADVHTPDVRRYNRTVRRASESGEKIPNPNCWFVSFCLRTGFDTGCTINGWWERHNFTKLPA